MTKTRPRTPEAVIAALLVAFVVVGIAAGRERGGSSTGAATAQVVAEVDTIAHRVEQIRHLRFKKLPKPIVVTPEATRRAALADLDKKYPPERRHNDAQLLELMGLVPPGTDLRTISGDISGQEVAGYYDTERKRLAIVSGPASANKVLTEITLAHELTHALEDQRFGVNDKQGSGADDGVTAYTALVEGTATDVMTEYTQRFIPPGQALASAFAALGPSAASTKSIPPYLQRSLEFSYTGGQRFVQSLRDVAGSWKLVNYALRSKPPISSEQVIHPEKYMRFERPLPVTIGDPGLSAGWKHSSRGTMGELDTRELLRVGNDVVTATNAAAGWGGGRYELWRNASAERGCDDPCRSATALVLRWRWDTPADAREFDAALPLYVIKGLHGSAAGAARWKVGDGGAAVAVTGGPAGTTTLALAQSPDEAARLAASSAGG